jgi:phosphatidylglycerol:prolipoprotein diacylglycerol transferase
VRRHPSAFYELVLDLVLFIVILRLRDRMPRPGDLFKLYIVGYCSLRFLVDFTRAEPRVLLGLTLVQVIYIFAIIGFGLQLLASFRESRQAKTIPEGQTADAG